MDAGGEKECCVEDQSKERDERELQRNGTVREREKVEDRPMYVLETGGESCDLKP